MGQSDFFFSIIIPTYNRADLVAQTIESIRKQTNINIEIIVVDDGGHDHTEQVISQLSDDRVKYVRIDNVERGAARNFGLRIASGRYVNFFDSDDLMSHCLSELSLFIEANNYPPVIFGSIANITEDGIIEAKSKRPYLSFKKNLLHNNFLACGAVFARREIVMEFLFSESRALSGTEDWELWLRLFAKYDFVEFPRVVFMQRQHKNRSLRNWNPDQINERETDFFQKIELHRSLLLLRYSNTELNLLQADRMTLIALAQSIHHRKADAIRYLIKALKSSLKVITRKRFWAVMKKMIYF